ncbi:MAG: hypothetical protein OEY99_08330 [Aigarchaeota archaeon]|nr:hypothetical protein [Aigarchaeota archaeon]
MSEALRRKLDAAIGAFRDERLRWLVGRSEELVLSGKMSREEFDDRVGAILQTEIERWLILNELKTKGPQTIETLSRTLGLTHRRILEHMIAMRWLGRVSVVEEEGDWYLYAATGSPETATEEETKR